MTENLLVALEKFINYLEQCEEIKIENEDENENFHTIVSRQSGYRFEGLCVGTASAYAEKAITLKEEFILDDYFAENFPSTNASLYPYRWPAGLLEPRLDFCKGLLKGLKNG